MARESANQALRQIRTLYALGPVGGLTDAAVRRAVPRGRGVGPRGCVRGAGGAARADGPEGLPPDAPRAGRRGGRIPGRLPRAGAEGRAMRRVRRLKPWLYGVAVRTAKEARTAVGQAAGEGGAGDGRRGPRSRPDDGAGRRARSVLDEEITPPAPPLPRSAPALRAGGGLAAGRRAAARAPRGDALQPAGPGPVAAPRSVCRRGVALGRGRARVADLVSEPAGTAVARAARRCRRCVRRS